MTACFLPDKYTWSLVAVLLLATSNVASPDERESVRWLSALDQKTVKRHGDWSESRFRFAAASHLHTTQESAALELSFEGTAMAVRLGGHNVPAYGPASAGNFGNHQFPGHEAWYGDPVSPSRDQVDSFFRKLFPSSRLT